MLSRDARFSSSGSVSGEPAYIFWVPSTKNVKVKSNRTIEHDAVGAVTCTDTDTV